MIEFDSKVRDIDIDIAVVPPHSRWAFVRLTTADGEFGLGEATINRFDDVLTAWVSEARRTYAGRQLSEMWADGRPHFDVTLGGLAGQAVASALDQACWDRLGKILDAPLHVLLGASKARPVPLYANLNRGLSRRSASDFASAARAAVSAGMTAVKCAPFDGVLPGPLIGPQRELFEVGLDRVAAVRASVGTDIAVLVDCHWRFDMMSAVTVVRELAPLAPYWIEAPVSEAEPKLWHRAKDAAECMSAGGEMLTGAQAFQDFMSASGVDVVMPDPKYCGGVRGLLKIATLAQASGIRVAPHNPSGPVASLVCGHAMQAMESFLMLEFPWGEWEGRAEFARGSEEIRGGQLHLKTDPGLGIQLDFTKLEASPATHTTPTLSGQKR